MHKICLCDGHSYLTKATASYRCSKYNLARTSYSRRASQRYTLSHRLFFFSFFSHPHPPFFHPYYHYYYYWEYTIFFELS